jgi:hypothetical protein
LHWRFLFIAVSEESASGIPEVIGDWKFDPAGKGNAVRRFPEIPVVAELESATQRLIQR